MGGLGIHKQHQLYSKSLSPCCFGITGDYVSKSQQNNQAKLNKQQKNKKNPKKPSHKMNTNVIIKKIKH